MTPLNIRLRKSEFDAVAHGRQTEIVKYASNKRIHYMCFERMTYNCKEPQSKCRACYDARLTGGYECYPYDKVIIRRGDTDKRITRMIEELHCGDNEIKIKVKGHE